VDQDLIDWIDREIERLDHGEVGVIFVIHEGQIQRCEKIVREKKKIILDCDDKSVV